MLQPFLNEIFTALIALFAGIMAYKRMNLFRRVLFIQLLTWVSIYALSYLVTAYQKGHKIPLNNHWVFNIATIIECTLLAYAAFVHFKAKLKRKIICALYIFFMFSSAILIYRNGFKVFSIYSYAFESLLVSITYSMILYECFEENISLKIQNPDLWICVGLVMYFAVNLPYFSLFNFLNENYPDLSDFLHRAITEILSNLRYLFLAIGFWIIWKHPNLKTTPIK